jgi:hypothetical protein
VYNIRILFLNEKDQFRVIQSSLGLGKTSEVGRNGHYSYGYIHEFPSITRILAQWLHSNFVFSPSIHLELV